MSSPFNRTLPLATSYDVVMARQHAREMARAMGFGLTDQTRIATAVSEVCHRALNHGSISFDMVNCEIGPGIECVCLGCDWQEKKPYPSGEVMGGLRGVERLMDEFALEQRNGSGTAVIMRKWLKSVVVRR